MLKLDYLLGRQVERIDQHGQNWNWTIRLDGNVKIKNRDHARTVPPQQIVGTTFLSARDNGKVVTLSFGNVFPDPATGTAQVALTAEIPVTIGKLTVTAPDQDEHDPYAEDDSAADLPPDPSSERVVSGPEKP